MILLYRGPGADQLEADLQLGGGDCLGILRPVGKRGRDGRTESGS